MDSNRLSVERFHGLIKTSITPLGEIYVKTSLVVGELPHRGHVTSALEINLLIFLEESLALLLHQPVEIVN